MTAEGSAGEGLAAELGRFAQRLSYEELPAGVREMAEELPSEEALASFPRR
jgi:hypothetical protein